MAGRGGEELGPVAVKLGLHSLGALGSWQRAKLYHAACTNACTLQSNCQHTPQSCNIETVANCFWSKYLAATTCLK
jgi:hypothetical protein